MRAYKLAGIFSPEFSPLCTSLRLDFDFHILLNIHHSSNSTSAHIKRRNHTRRLLRDTPMKWRTLLVASRAIRSPPCRSLPPTAINKLRRPLSFQTIPRILRNLFSGFRDAQVELDTRQLLRVRRLAPMGDIQLLQRMLGLAPQRPQREDLERLKDVVFVCIDCEAFEFDHEKIMEIGVSVLDTKKLDSVSPQWR